MNTRKYAAEAIGTFWLTFGGCGSAVIVFLPKLGRVGLFRQPHAIPSKLLELLCFRRIPTPSAFRPC